MFEFVHIYILGIVIFWNCLFFVIKYNIDMLNNVYLQLNKSLF